MPPLPSTESRFPVSTAIWLVTGLLALVLVVMFKFAGLLLGLIIIGAAWLMIRSRPQSPELLALRSSVALSADDIRSTLECYRAFLHSEEPEAVADRTLHRPELANPDTDDPEIARFRHSCLSAHRFLRRLASRLQNPQLSVRQLEKLLHATDARALAFEEQWQAARRAAAALGTRGTRGTRSTQRRDTTRERRQPPAAE